MESLIDIIDTRKPDALKQKKKKLILIFICSVLILAVSVFVVIYIATGAEINDPEASNINDEGNAKDNSPMDNPQTDAPQHEDPDITWELVLVNFENPAPAGYIPKLKDIGNDEYFDERATESLLDMLQAAYDEDLSPVVCSAYRDIEFQKELYKIQVETQMENGLSYEDAHEEAKKVVAYPGTSEHQLGIAVDIVAKSYQSLDEAQADTDESKWLKENCYKYGFILRYPPDKTDITGVIFEPWHYRYVGKDAAAVIMSENISLEEYLELY